MEPESSSTNRRNIHFIAPITSQLTAEYYVTHVQRDRDSVVGVATGYELDCPGIESQWGGGRNFPLTFRPALGLTKHPVQWVPGRGVDQSPPPGAEVKKG